MTRAADFPHNIPTDSLGLLAREPRAKTGAELRQETVYEVVRETVRLLADREMLAEFADALSLHEVTRPIANAIHDALAVTREEKRAVDMVRSIFAGVNWQPEEMELIARRVDAVSSAQQLLIEIEDMGRVLPVMKKREWDALGELPASIILEACATKEEPEEDGVIKKDEWDAFGSLCHSTVSDMVRHQDAMSAYIGSHIGKPAQPPAQAPKVEEWMKLWAPRARAYKSGDLGLDTALRWARTPQGKDYWSSLWRKETPYPGLPKEARDYIDLIASADGGE